MAAIRLVRQQAMGVGITLGVLMVLTLAMMLVLGSFPALASVQNVSAADYDVQNGRVVRVSGFITCSPGMDFIIRVNVTDDDGNKAIGRAHGSCDTNGGDALIQGGDLQGTQWITTRVKSATGFTAGECVLARGQARTTQDGDRQSFSGFIGPCGG